VPYFIILHKVTFVKYNLKIKSNSKIGYRHFSFECAYVESANFYEVEIWMVEQTNEWTNERTNKRTNGFKVFKVEILQHFSFAYESSIAHISSPKMGVQFINWNLQIQFIFCNFKTILKFIDPNCKAPQNKKVGSKVNYLQTRFCNIT
jgi:hypothetical protein